MLIKKTFRDFIKNGSQFIATILMSFICLFIFTGITQMSEQMTSSFEAFEKKSNLADVILTGQAFSEKERTKLEKMNDIKDSQKRLVGSVFVDDDTTLKVLSFTKNKISKPVVIEGEALSTKKGIWLDDDFMHANKLNLGQSFTFNDQTFEILGSVKQPEFVYFTASQDQPVPNYKTNGYAYLNEEDFLTAVPLYTEQLLVKTKKLQNETWFENELNQTLGSNLKEITFQDSFPGLKIFKERALQIKRLAFLFSGLFLLLTIISMEATMSRFIRQQQLILGSFKAQGLSSRQILTHYLFFGFSTSTLGSSLGCYLGPVFLTPTLLRFMKKMYSLPTWLTASDSSGFVLAAILILLSVLVTMRPVFSLLKQEPAVILANQTTIKVRRTSLEKLFFWSKLPFSLQWTLRDVQRNIQRCLLGIFGAIGCMVLLLAAFGVKDSIEYSIDNVFSKTYHYQEKVSFQQPLNEQQKQQLTDELKGTHQWLEQEFVDLILKDRSFQTNLLTFSKGDSFQFEDNSGNSLNVEKLKNNEVIIAEALAKRLGISQGDTIYLQFEQTIVPIFIKKIALISAPQGLFTSQTVWKNVNQTFTPNALMLQENENISKINDEPFVASSVSKKQQRADSSSLLDSILFIVSLLIFAALVLGITIMLNAHLLIFSERYIEFATLKVLGFTQKELFNLSFLENFFLTLVGWLISLPLGWKFLTFYVATVSTENQQFLPHLSLKSIATATIILLLCTLIVQWIILRRIRKIDFATALKSAD